MNAHGISCQVHRIFKPVAISCWNCPLLSDFLCCKISPCDAEVQYHRVLMYLDGFTSFFTLVLLSFPFPRTQSFQFSFCRAPPAVRCSGLPLLVALRVGTYPCLIFVFLSCFRINRQKTVLEKSGPFFVRAYLRVAAGEPSHISSACLLSGWGTRTLILTRIL